MLTSNIVFTRMMLFPTFLLLLPTIQMTGHNGSGSRRSTLPRRSRRKLSQGAKMERPTVQQLPLTQTAMMGQEREWKRKISHLEVCVEDLDRESIRPRALAARGWRPREKTPGPKIGSRVTALSSVSRSRLIHSSFSNICLALNRAKNKRSSRPLLSYPPKSVLEAERTAGSPLRPSKEVMPSR